jgi:polyphosphate kinase 2 (PPK2 family)
MHARGVAWLASIAHVGDNLTTRSANRLTFFLDALREAQGRRVLERLNEPSPN